MKDKILYVILILTVFALIFTYGHHGHLIVDFGREAYIPMAMCDGQVLYKDILNIYGPFGYMLNALLYNIFGPHLNVLFVLGGFCACIITTFIYLLAKRFVPRYLSFGISLILLVLGVLTPSLFNFVYPYSYDILYGTCSLLISLFLLLRYSDTKNIQLLYFSGLLGGVSLACKYEFVLYLIPYIYGIWKFLKPDFKTWLKLLGVFFAPILSCFIILFIQGVSIDDLLKALWVIKSMVASQTLKFFYTMSGVYFTPQTLVKSLVKFIPTFFYVVSMFFLIKLFSGKLWQKIIAVIVLAELFYLMKFEPYMFCALPIFTALLGIIKFKKIKNDTELQILILTTFLIGLKPFWCMIPLAYGIYSFGLYLLSSSAMFSDTNIKKSICTFLIVLSCLAGLDYYYVYKNINTPVKTERGMIYYNKAQAECANELIDYIKKMTKSGDKIVIYPEGALFNFLTNRKTDDYYWSMIPLYAESFGEQNLMAHFKQNPPEYFIFNAWDTSEYGFKEICKDYMMDFCAQIYNDYDYVKNIGGYYSIFRKKTNS